MPMLGPGYYRSRRGRGFRIHEAALATPFQNGDDQVQSQAGATDPNYGNTVTASTTTVVKLRQK